MTQKRGFVKFYLFLTIIFGILGIIDSLLVVFQIQSTIYDRIMGILLLLFLFFNLMAIALFQYYRVERIAFVLPIYHIISYGLFVFIGFWLIFKAITSAWVSPVLIVVGIATSLFEILFSIYVLVSLKIMGVGSSTISHNSR